MATLTSLKELTTWDEYRSFTKERLRGLPDGSAIYVSKDKIDFDINGKPWSGYAVLVGSKSEEAVKGIRKEGVQFRDGTCRIQGNEILVTGIADNYVKGAELTFAKLRLGYSIAVDEGEDTAGAEARLAELVAEIKEAAALGVADNKDVLKQAATRAKEAEGALGKGDPELAEKRLEEIEELLTEVDEGDEDDGDADPDLAGLSDFKAYRKFMKAHLKRLPPEGGPIFVSRKKQAFTIKGKPFKGHAVLVGKKARLTVLALKKEGTLFKEGTCRRDGKKLLVSGIPAVLFKGAVKTTLKLRLGRKLVAEGEFPEDDGAAVDADGDADLDTGASSFVGSAADAVRRAAEKVKDSAGEDSFVGKVAEKVQEVAGNVVSAAVADLVKEVDAALVKLEDAVDALKEAKLKDQPYRGDLIKLTKQLEDLKASKEDDGDKLPKLKKLKTKVVERTLDAGVAKLDPKDPKSGAIIVKQMKARFGIEFKFDEKLADGTVKAADPAKEGETLKQLYLTMSKAPAFPKDHLKTIETTLQPASADGEGGVYYKGSKKAGIDCKRPKDSMDYNNQLASPRYFPDGVDEDCKPANNEPVKYFDWATLHEVAHAVDAQHSFMDSNGSKDKFGGWTQYGNNVAPIAKAAAKEFGKGLGDDDLAALEAYANAVLSGGSPPAARSPEEAAKRPALDAWAAAVRVGKNIWWNGGECVNRAIDGVVYQESYGKRWTSYKLAARKQGIHGYQFRAPGEWFAELYAAHYSKKLKPSHPFVPELQKLEK